MNASELQLIFQAIQLGLPIADELISAISGLINHPAVVATPQLQVLQNAPARVAEQLATSTGGSAAGNVVPSIPTTTTIPPSNEVLNELPSQL